MSTRTAQIIDGKAISKRVRAEVRATVDGMVARGARPPGLAVVMVGDNPASAVYVRNKRLACADCGIRSVDVDLPQSTSELERMRVRAKGSFRDGVVELADSTATLELAPPQAERLALVPLAEGFGYGFGVMGVDDWIGHNGTFPPGYQSIALHDPLLDQTIVVLANSWSTDGYHFPDEVSSQIRPLLVPEPSTFALLALGAAVTWFGCRRGAAKIS